MISLLSILKENKLIMLELKIIYMFIIINIIFCKCGLKNPNQYSII